MDGIKPRTVSRRVGAPVRASATALSEQARQLRAKRVKLIARTFGNGAMFLSGIRKHTPIKRNYRPRLKSVIKNFYFDNSTPKRVVLASFALIMFTAVVIQVTQPKTQY